MDSNKICFVKISTLYYPDASSILAVLSLPVWKLIICEIGMLQYTMYTHIIIFITITVLSLKRKFN